MSQPETELQKGHGLRVGDDIRFPGERISRPTFRPSLCVVFCGAVYWMVSVTMKPTESPSSFCGRSETTSLPLTLRVSLL